MKKLTTFSILAVLAIALGVGGIAGGWWTGGHETIAEAAAPACRTMCPSSSAAAAATWHTSAATPTAGRTAR